MTIAISIKVQDGIVLASDSASSIIDVQQNVQNVYNNANKIFNLHKKKPVGAATWGAGNFGNASISTIVKDFREKWTADGLNCPDMNAVTTAFKDFLYTEHYDPAFGQLAPEKKPVSGFFVVGYAESNSEPQVWRLDFPANSATMLQGSDIVGCSFAGQPEALSRLFMGYATGLPTILKQKGLDDQKVIEIVQNLQVLQSNLIHPAMPIKDAIDLAEFMVETTVGYVRFMPGAQTVGGPIEIAAITKHEGFKWIKRKHYYDNKYNVNHIGGNNEH